MNPACPKCGSETKIHEERLKSYAMRCLSCGHNFSIPKDDDILVENVRLAKKTQKLQDTNRIERKSFREYARLENTLTEYNISLIEAIKKHSLNTRTKKHKIIESNSTGILQLTDPHFNELISKSNNKYDFTVGSKRLMDYANEAIIYFRAKGVKTVVFAMTGDLINSDRRLDELLNMSTNRANATILATLLIKQMILHLNQFFNIKCLSVTGNESRASQEQGFSDILATDNYDSTIFNMLRCLFTDSNVEFILGDPKELVVTIHGKNILFLHGETVNTNVTKSIQQTKGKYASKNIIIDFVVFGHLHESRISDGYARGSSLCGDNDYSDKALNLAGRASQNIHIINSHGTIHSIKIDLQETFSEGYEIKKELESYHAKSADKSKQKKVIFEVVI